MSVRALKPFMSAAEPEPPADDAMIAPGEVLGVRGDLSVRMAAGEDDIAASQALRYRVFYEEMSAVPDDQMRRVRRDQDGFDAICDHLLVIAPAGNSGEKTPILTEGGEVVGSYRLLRQDVAARNWGFYTADEYDVEPLLKAKGGELNFLELGRSCVLRPYRTKPVIELLWQGIWKYVQTYHIDVLIGCASLEGTDPDRVAHELSFLHHKFRAPQPWRVRAQPDRYVEMNRIHRSKLNERETMRNLPPLIKGYLRLGACVGDGAVVDNQFNSIDVLIVLPISSINQRYIAHFSLPEEKAF